MQLRWQFILTLAAMTMAGACGSASDPGAAGATPPVSEQRSVVIQFDNSAEALSGRADIAMPSGIGRLLLALPKARSGAPGTCSGSLTTGGADGGSWSVSCTNGLLISGLFRAFDAARSARGSGRDSEGRTVWFYMEAPP